MMDNNIPTPAIIIGNKIGDKPSKASTNFPPPTAVTSCPNTIVAKTVAT